MITWYAVVTNPKCERRAEAGLREAGIATFLPQGAIWTKPRRSPAMVGRPRLAMPRYLFIGDRGDPMFWHAVRSTNGVAGVVGQSGIPLQIKSTTLESIFDRQFTGGLNFNDRPRRKRGWKPGHYERGMRLEIKGGPLTGFIGTVRRSSGKEKVDIEVILFGTTTATSVRLDDVKIAA